MELPGVEIVALLNTLLMAASLLSMGLLLALVVIGRPGHSRPGTRVILLPVPTPERVEMTCGRPDGLPRMSLLTHAPPVSPQPVRHGYRDHCTVE